jgi:hypothetical protein
MTTSYFVGVKLYHSFQAVACEQGRGLLTEKDFLLGPPGAQLFRTIRGPFSLEARHITGVSVCYQS